MVKLVISWWLMVINWLWGVPSELITMRIPKEAVVTITQTPTPPPLPLPTRVITPKPPKIVEDPNLPKEWGVAKQVGEHTWTMRVGQDLVMATPKEIMAALNDYRRRNGSAELMWDEKLVSYAQSRADFFISNKGLDSHKGFGEYLENQDGFNKLGFNAVGENSSYGYTMTGTHLIEWIFAGDEPHDKNQLNKDWAYVGIGVNNNAVDIIFGTGKF